MLFEHDQDPLPIAEQRAVLRYLDALLERHRFGNGRRSRRGHGRG